MVTKFDIDKFEGKISFAIWKVHMQAVLTHHGYKKARRGIAHKPQSMSDEYWLELDEKALATIQLFLTREVLLEVIHETTATSLWLKLESLYMTKSLANKLRLKDRLYTFRMKPGTSVQDHLDEFNTILIDLENLDVDIDDEEKAVLLKVVKGWLQEAEVLTELKNKLEREGKRNNEKKPEKAAEVAIAKGGSDGDVYLAIDTEKSRDDLIVDSGCTFHMIPHQSWYTTYESFNGGGVMKIFKGALVLMKAIQSGGLYVLQGSSHVTSREGKRYMLTIIDDFSRKVWVFFLKHKDEVFPTFKEWKMLIENQTRKKIKKLRTDNGLEFCGESFNALCRKDVTFNEDVIINSGKDFVPPHNVDNNHTEGKVEFEFDVENITHTQPPFNDEHIETQDNGNMPTSLQSQPQTEYLLAWDHERRQVIRPPRLEDYQCDLVAYVFSAAAHIENYEPTNYLEAISSPECDKWVVAMEEEVESFHKNKTCELVKLNKEKRVISCKWLFKVKDGIPGIENNQYKARVLKKFNMSSYKLVPTPLAPHFMLSSHECPKSEEDKVDMSRVPYSSAVGSLMYAMVCTRLDLAHAELRNIGLSFEKGRASPNGVVGYVDSDYAGDLDARKSLSSYIFSRCGSAISWYSSLQAITALSTTEAEYISTTEGVNEAIWLRGMVNEFGLPQEVLVVYCDNRSVVHLTKNKKFHFKTKHIEVRHHFVRDIVEKEEVIVDKIHTNDNLADMLTKALTPTKFKHCLDLVGFIGV
uniref:Retrovirus-related Pol polyprotein from transposon TNT 1-94 n=1 Tax=Tanacetum cinerariifolium TaxID=118510 RepID=A0A6L2NUL6_TANCI|nr:retrovirus-related Pol polyprotein from transposon TNT 1-94 [Tanacetum cinerariifolium]